MWNAHASIVLGGKSLRGLIEPDQLSIRVYQMLLDMSELGGKYLNWSGRSDEGYTLSSGVYLLSVFNPDYGTGVTKLAVINK